MSRYFLFPSYCRKTSWEKASHVFTRQGEKIVALTQGLSDEQLGKPVLIERLRGLEDSSRFWSIAMTLEHLVIVGRLMLRGVVLLSRGDTPTDVANTATVKPKGALVPEEALAAFNRFQNEYTRTVENEVRDRNAKGTYRHPWFGPLTAHRWHCLAGIHQGLHRKQIEAIRAGLGAQES